MSLSSLFMNGKDMTDLNERVIVNSEPGVSWTPSAAQVSSADLGEYEDDVALRQLAASQTACFGHYSTASAECKKCPLASFCSRAVSAHFGDIAARLDRSTEVKIDNANKEFAARVANRKTEEERLRRVEEQERRARERADFLKNNPPDPDRFNDDGEDLVELPFEGVCSGCSETLPTGTMVVHVASAGMFHPACAKKYKSKAR